MARSIPLVDRFWSKVKKSEDPNGCWVWTGSTSWKGYGRIAIVHGKVEGAHRVSAMLAGMKIEGVLVMHKCDNRPCVRPDHLFTGTPKDNMDDMIAKGRARHPRGQDHQFAKLTPQVAAEIRKATGSQRQIARVFGIGRTTVQNVRNGKAWIPEVTA